MVAEDKHTRSVVTGADTRASKMLDKKELVCDYCNSRAIGYRIDRPMGLAGGKYVVAMCINHWPEYGSAIWDGRPLGIPDHPFKSINDKASTGSH